MKYYLAIDMGASSGRHIVGWKTNGKIYTREVYRFSNGVETSNGHLIWNTERLFNEVKYGIKMSFEQFNRIESISVDTWGVDYVLIDNDGKELPPCYSYRDNHTSTAIRQVHELMPFDLLYSRTGIQFQPFNSIYKLFADCADGRLRQCSSFLMLPEYINYRLTGVIKKEYTNATTTGLVNVETQEFDKEIIATLSLPEKLFPSLSKPGEVVGHLLPEIVAEVGGQSTVMLCGSHDTASAFEAMDMEKDSILISSGTWSLIGAKICKANTSMMSKNANFTNEGGIGYIRYLKNVMGLWFNVRLHQEFELEYAEMQSLAKLSKYNKVFDVNDPVFTAPECMSAAIKKWYLDKGITPPETQADIINSVYISLAAEYKKSIAEIEMLTGIKYNTIYIVGGGAKNEIINSYTAELTGKNIIPMPIEATAIGNLKIQMR